MGIVNNAVAVSMTSINTFYQVTTNWVQDPCNGFTFGSSALTALYGGPYLTTAAFSLGSASTSNLVVNIQLFKNGVAITSHNAYAKMTNSSDIDSVSFTGVIDTVNPGDVFDVRIQSTSHSGQTIVVTYANLSITAIQGARGDRGSQGLDGIDGDDGSPGPPGPQGPQGLTGNSGPQGVATFLEADAGQDGTDGIPGPQGPQGNPGPAGLPGAAIYMDAEQGIDGDIGPPGQAGAAGATGSTGPQGAAGVSVFVEDGPPGEDGAPGPAGQAGAAGATGPAGPPGPPGADGEGGGGDDGGGMMRPEGLSQVRAYVISALRI
jgi:hypothetical protein